MTHVEEIGVGEKLQGYQPSGNTWERGPSTPASRDVHGVGWGALVPSWEALSEITAAAVRPPRLWGLSFQGNPGPWRDTVRRFTPRSPQRKETRARTGRAAGGERPSEPLPQRRFSSKLLPWLPRRGEEGHRRAPHTRRAPAPPHPHPSALRAGERPSGGSAPGEERKRAREERGSLGDRKKRGGGRARAGTAGAASAPRQWTAPAPDPARAEPGRKAGAAGRSRGRGEKRGPGEEAGARGRSRGRGGETPGAEAGGRRGAKPGPRGEAVAGEEKPGPGGETGAGEEKPGPEGEAGAGEEKPGPGEKRGEAGAGEEKPGPGEKAGRSRGRGGETGAGGRPGERRPGGRCARGAVTFPGRRRSAAGRARAGWVHVAPGELRRRLKGTARRARHSEALPAPRPRPSVTSRGRGAPRGGAAGAGRGRGRGGSGGGSE